MEPQQPTGYGLQVRVCQKADIFRQHSGFSGLLVVSEVYCEGPQLRKLFSNLLTDGMSKQTSRIGEGTTSSGEAARRCHRWGRHPEGVGPSVAAPAHSYREVAGL